MSRIITSTAKYTLFGGILATGVWTAAVYRQSSKVDRRNIVTSDAVSDAFRDSFGHKLVNPQQLRYTPDSRTIKLQITSEKPIAQDQVVIWMLNGFFRSWVFAPEEVVLRNVVRTTGKDFTKLSGLPKQPPQPILYSKQLSDSLLPPLYTLLFGAFQIVDIWQTKSDENECGFDLAYGWNRGTFAGCHRLSAATLQEGEESYLQLTFACITCNPTDDGRRSWVVSVLSAFHKTYAEILFRAVVGEVVSKLGASGARVRPVAEQE